MKIAVITLTILGLFAVGCSHETGTKTPTRSRNASSPSLSCTIKESRVKQSGTGYNIGRADITCKTGARGSYKVGFGRQGIESTGFLFVRDLEASVSNDIFTFSYSNYFATRSTGSLFYRQISYS